MLPEVTSKFMSGHELRNIQNQYGIAPEAVSQEAGVSMSTLYKVYNDKHVRPATRAKVRNALARLSAKINGQLSAARLAVS